MGPRWASLAASSSPMAKRLSTLSPFSFAQFNEHALESSIHPAQQPHLTLHQPRHLDPSLFTSMTAIIVYVATGVFMSIVAAILFYCCVKPCKRKHSRRKQQGAILTGDGVPGRFPQERAPPPAHGIWTGKKAGRVDWGNLGYWHAKC